MKEENDCYSWVLKPKQTLADDDYSLVQNWGTAVPVQEPRCSDPGPVVPACVSHTAVI